MNATAHAVLFGSACLVAAVVIAAWCLTRWRDEQREDAAYDAQRDAGMGDLAGSETPIFDVLAAEVARSAARYIDTEWWLYDQEKGEAR